MCDTYLGKVLDAMDELDLWKDTLLIVNTDHGFLLGEHDWWAKVAQPFYEEVAHYATLYLGPASGRGGVSAAVRWCRPLTCPRRSWSTSASRSRAICRAYRCVRPSPMTRPVRAAGLFGLHGAQGERHGWPLCLHARASQPGEQAAVRVHADAGAYAPHLRRRRTAGDRFWQSRSRSPKDARRCRSRGPQLAGP